jgi:hypothetical protein
VLQLRDRPRPVANRCSNRARAASVRPEAFENLDRDQAVQRDRCARNNHEPALRHLALDAIAMAAVIPASPKRSAGASIFTIYNTKFTKLFFAAQQLF